MFWPAKPFARYLRQIAIILNHGTAGRPAAGASLILADF
jgi:hypothetical protein